MSDSQGGYHSVPRGFDPAKFKVGTAHYTDPSLQHLTTTPADQLRAELDCKGIYDRVWIPAQ
jgi:hypothetical protein